MNYYYSTGGSDFAGPYSLTELVSLFDSGALTMTTQVCREGEQTWQPISSILPTTSPRETTTLKQDASPVVGQRNPLLLPLIALVALLIITVAGGGFYFARRSAAPRVLLTPAPVPTPELIPVTPTTPTVSEDTKSRVLAFIEKASKLSVMTRQGVNYSSFSDQLAEVKSSWDTLAMVWPESWADEKRGFTLAINGWDIANEMWEDSNKVKLDSLLYDIMRGEIRILRPNLDKYAEDVAVVLNDNRIRVALKEKLDDLDEKYMEINVWNTRSFTNGCTSVIISWSFAASSRLCEKAREGVKSHLSR